ncbi:MAG: hypothetical protein R3354_02315 [Thiohalomonadales bacterium]|nr:hypothetical protein [Thiohalomonadales bacterium]
MERIATLARKKSSGLGPISLKDLCNVYEDVCGIEPDEKGLNILQKLPGLGVDNEEDQSRSFIDEDLADACRSGDILLFAKNYSAFENGEEKIDISSGFEVPIGNICALIVAMKSETEGFPLSHALYIAAQKGLHQFSMDILKSGIVRGEKTEKEIYIHSSFGGDINFSSMETRNLSKVNFFSCYFNSINITGIDHSKLPKFRECYIAKLFTPDPPNQRPSAFCSDSVIERIENHTPSITNTALLNLDLPILTKVKLSILRKIYLQAGNGRVENALYAGLDHTAKQIVPDAIKDLESKGIIRHLRRPGKTVIWQPSPQHKSNVLAVIDNPESDTENILQ